MNQAMALAIMESGQNVLLTGSAGTGKTYVLNKFIRRMRSLGYKVAPTATTGLAATHLGGTTIHSYSGMGVAEFASSRFIDKIAKAKQDAIRKLDILVIDEISMLSGFRLDIIDAIFRRIRAEPKPFGGVQVVMSGDFFQLPPIGEDGSHHTKFVTESNIWRSGAFTVCYLTKSHRHAGDNEYEAFLNKFRRSELEGDDLMKIRRLVDETIDLNGDETKLFTTNRNVDAVNDRKLRDINGVAKNYHMSESGAKKYLEILKKNILASELLSLKIGAKVMFIKNSTDKTYVNGSIGRVVEFDNATDLPVVELMDGSLITVKPADFEFSEDGLKVKASVSQIPLKLAWAITVHKSQGMTLDEAVIDLSYSFSPGMGYVALSRVKSFAGLKLIGLSGDAFLQSEEAVDINNELLQKSAEAEQQFKEVLEQMLIKWRAEAAAPKKVKAIADDDTEKSDYMKRLEEKRKTYPNAGKSWSVEDQASIIDDYLLGMELDDIVNKYGRNLNSVVLKLASLLGLEAEDIAEIDFKPKNRIKDAEL